MSMPGGSLKLVPVNITIFNEYAGRKSRIGAQKYRLTIFSEYARRKSRISAQKYWLTIFNGYAKRK